MGQALILREEHQVYRINRTLFYTKGLMAVRKLY
jgi:hypothetical protein